jgi:hypothetical protein
MEQIYYSAVSGSSSPCPYFPVLLAGTALNRLSYIIGAFSKLTGFSKILNRVKL